MNLCVCIDVFVHAYALKPKCKLFNKIRATNTPATAATTKQLLFSPHTRPTLDHVSLRVCAYQHSGYQRSRDIPKRMERYVYTT